MIKALLQRGKSTDQGTFGILSFGNFACFTLELPDRDNLPQFSRVPEGEYVCSWLLSPKFGKCFQLMNVPHRNNILLHAGNFAGDVEQGYLSHSHGCILPCETTGRMEGQDAGLLSRMAVVKLHKALDKRSFTLVIRDPQEVK